MTYQIPEDLRPMLMKRQITLIGDVTGSKQEALSESIIYLNALSNEPITLFIDSCGGRALPGLIIGDMIENSEAPVHGVVTGCAYSSAFRILQSCHRRLIYEHGQLMFHPISLDGLRIDDEYFEEKLSKARAAYEELLKNLSERTRIVLRDLRRWGKEERIFDAKEAKKFGFVDEIIIPQKPWQKRG